uniref:hypothetical protein n=1 Tax=Fluviicola sp. TaxID=1917219 RepID=UPI00261DFD23
SSIVLSIMAIIVSIKSYQISNRQYESDLFDKVPDFEIIQTQIQNPENNLYEEAYLSISKISGKAKNIDIEIATFFDVTYMKDNKQKIFQFIVPDYYNTNYKTGKTEGEIQESTGYRNQKQLHIFQKQLDSLTKKQDIIYGNLKSFVRIKYLNFENKSVSCYYEVNLFGGNYIDSIIGKKRFENYHNLYRTNKIIDLSNPNASNKVSYMNSKF